MKFVNRNINQRRRSPDGIGAFFYPAIYFLYSVSRITAMDGGYTGNA